MNPAVEISPTTARTTTDTCTQKDNAITCHFTKLTARTDRPRKRNKMKNESAAESLVAIAIKTRFAMVSILSSAISPAAKLT
jgi:hypothetical protein